MPKLACMISAAKGLTHVAAELIRSGCASKDSFGPCYSQHAQHHTSFHPLALSENFLCNFACTRNADVKVIDMGKVRATVESTGKRQASGVTLLKQKSLPVKSSTLEYHLNMLLSTYDDPYDLIRVAEDLADRCRAEPQATASTKSLDTPNQESELQEGKKKSKLPSVTVCTEPDGLAILRHSSYYFLSDDITASNIFGEEAEGGSQLFYFFCSLRK